MKSKSAFFTIAILFNAIYSIAQVDEAFIYTKDNELCKIRRATTHTGLVGKSEYKTSEDSWAFKIRESNFKKFGFPYNIESVKESCQIEWNLTNSAKLNMFKEFAGLNSALTNEKEIKVEINDVFKTINITIAGTLSAMLTEAELNTVTNLTVTGKIDARDFVTMDKMPLLQVLDIGNATIIAYSGLGGTWDAFPNYLSNVIPVLAFDGNKNITSITIPSSATAIDYWAFTDFIGNINVDENSSYLSSLDGVLYDKNKTKLFRCPVSKTGSLTLPSTVTYIGHAAFWGCKNLTTINLSSALTTIEKYAFTYCDGLTSFNFPASVIFIGDAIFGGSSGSRKFNITVDEANQNFSSLDNVMFDKTKTRLIMSSRLITGSYSIPTTVRTIDPDAFSGCENITSISIPLSVTNIGSGAFGFCRKLTGTLTIPSSVTKIKGNTFVGCDFTSLILPNTITSIGSWAFMGNHNLTTVTIPSSVKFLGDGAFGCSGLTSIYANSSIPTIIESFVANSSSAEVFNSVNKASCKLYVPYATKVLYAAAFEWKDFSNIIEATNGFSVGSYNVKLEALESSKTVSLKANAKWSVGSDQTWLTVFPVSGSSNADLIFTATANPTIAARTAIVTVSSSGLESQTITITQEGALKKVSNNAGSLISNLTDDELKNITNLAVSGTIDARDFKAMRDNMPLLAVLDLSKTTIVTYTGTEGTASYSMMYQGNEIPVSAFFNDSTKQGKSALLEVVLPSSITGINSNSFKSCMGLTEITIPSSVNFINSAFQECSAFITVDNENLNYSSLDGVLYNKNKTVLIQCPISKKGNFTIPSSVTSIDHYAFANCIDLTGTLIIPESVTTIGFAAFLTCRGFKGILTIPSTVTSIGSYAFANCNGFTSLIIPSSVNSMG